jgi:hypothetical protein
VPKATQKQKKKKGGGKGQDFAFVLFPNHFEGESAGSGFARELEEGVVHVSEHASERPPARGQHGAARRRHANLVLHAHVPAKKQKTKRERERANKKDAATRQNQHSLFQNKSKKNNASGLVARQGVKVPSAEANVLGRARLRRSAFARVRGLLDVVGPAVEDGAGVVALGGARAESHAFKLVALLPHTHTKKKEKKAKHATRRTRKKNKERESTEKRKTKRLETNDF